MHKQKKAPERRARVVWNGQTEYLFAWFNCWDMLEIKKKIQTLWYVCRSDNRADDDNSDDGCPHFPAQCQLFYKGHRCLFGHLFHLHFWRTVGVCLRSFLHHAAPDHWGFISGETHNHDRDKNGKILCYCKHQSIGLSAHVTGPSEGAQRV